MAKKCLEEMKERVAKGKEVSGWEEERRAFFENKRLKFEEVMEEEDEVGEWFAGLEWKDIEEQRRER